MTQRVIETSTGYMIRCPACQWHEFPKVGKLGASWTFNGNLERPTFQPSMNYRFNPSDSKHYSPNIKSSQCHFIVTNGRIAFCGDCTHHLKGQTLELEPWPEAEAEVKLYEIEREGK